MMQKKRKEKRRDSKVWKRFLDIIIQQLPSYIAQYPLSDQVLLNEFLTILKEYNVDIVTNREKIFDQLRISSQNYRDDERYLQLPFLWFVVDYFENASRLLRVTDFYADNFYEYLVSSLRGDSQTLGAFNLLRDTIPLNEQIWEELQYKCNSPSPLNNNELQVLEIVYSLISKSYIDLLNPNKIKKAITMQVPVYDTKRSVSKFFATLNGLWNILYNLAAFDLCRVYFFIQLEKSCSLAQIIDFQDDKNTTLLASVVYHVENIPNSYMGILIVPELLLTNLQSYIHYFHIQGKILSYKLEKITEIRISTSLAQYKETKGWQKTSNSRWVQITKQLTSFRQRKPKQSLESYFLTESLNNNWHFQMYDNPIEVVRLFCKSARNYTYNNLPYNLTDENNPLYFSKNELTLLRTLYGSKISLLWFFPSRLISEFSLDRYWVEIPDIPIFQLNKFLVILPFAQIYSNEKGYYLWTALTPELAHMIKKDLNWVVSPITRAYFTSFYSEKWFDSKIQQWRTPLVLEKRKDNEIILSC
jgi:hypothetical protein